MIVFINVMKCQWNTAPIVICFIDTWWLIVEGI